jgi:isopropylmalate/homocitrate/citramalate synthase
MIEAGYPASSPEDFEANEIMLPEDVGLRESRVVLTALTGRHGLRDRLNHDGSTLGRNPTNWNICTPTVAPPPSPPRPSG